MQSRLLSLVCLVAVCVLPVLGEVAVTDATVVGARLLVQKSLGHHAAMPFNFARDTPINVTLTAINIGDAPATGVVLEDSWAAGFDLAGAGSLTHEWAEIAAGQSVSVSYFVNPTADGEFEAAPARVTYQAKPSGPKVTGYSTSTTNLNVIPAETFARLTNTHVGEWSIFSGLLALFVLAPAFKWYELSSSYVKSGRRKAD